MLEGLYKVEMHTVHGSRRGVLYFYDGKMMGGSSAFVYIGTYTDEGAVAEATALVGKRSVRFSAVLKKMAGV